MKKPRTQDEWLTFGIWILLIVALLFGIYVIGSTTTSAFN